MDEHDETLPNHVFMSLRYEFKITRVMEQKLSPATIKIKTDFSTQADEDVGDDYGTRMEIALAKMSYWVNEVLDGSIVIDADNEWALGCFMNGATPMTDNSVMLCPEEPTDAHLAELLMSKFKALTVGAFEFHAIDIESTDGRGIGFTFVGQRPGQSLISDAEWLTERNYFSKPWWHRGDASCLDVVPEAEDNLNEPPVWAYSLGFIADQFADHDAPSNVVVRAEFRPQVIVGGKE